MAKGQLEPECKHGAGQCSKECAECQDEKKAARKYRWKIIGGLVLPFSLQALDVTLIATALPSIARDFGEIPQLNWIIASFNLTSAAFIPFWGQIADVFGRHSAAQSSVVITIIGSAICTGAPTDSFAAMLLGRAVQGVGCAGLNVVCRVIIADKVSLQESAKNWSIFSLFSGISFGIGPWVGGFLTSVDWRWCFAINLPIGVLGILTIIFFLRRELLGPQPLAELDETTETGRRTTFVKRLKTIDIGGQVLFLLGFGLVVLALTWGGATYAWDSAAVLVCLVSGTVLVLGFVAWEFLLSPGQALANRWPWQKPMIPWDLIYTRDVGILTYSTLCMGMATYSVLYFCSLYFVWIKGDDPDEAGVNLLLYVPGLGVGVYASALLFNKWIRQSFLPIFLGAVTQIVGVGLLAWTLHTGHTPSILGMMALVGVSAGLRIMIIPLHGIGLFRQNTAAIVALLAVAFPFGGTLGATVMSAILNNLSGGVVAESTDFSDLERLSGGNPQQALENIQMGIVWAFVAITPFMVLDFIGILFVGNVKTVKGGDDVIERDVYLLKLLRRRRRHQEEIELT